MHKRIHEQEKRFVCEFKECKAAFINSSALGKHRRTHTKVKPYVCNFENCQAAFSESSNLSRHKRTHTGQKSYICDFEGCTAAFVGSGDLTKHKRIHNGIRPFVCNVEQCGEAFAQSCQVKNHNFYWHTKEGQVRKKRDEARVLRLLEKAGFHLKAQHTIDFICIGPDRDGDRCYVDFLVEIRDEEGKVKGYVFLEVDEHQHKGYNLSCELRRMSDVIRTLNLEGNTLPIIFLRYNPHDFTVDNVKQKVLLRDKEAKLVDYLRKIDFEEPFSVIYMFYDTVDGEPYIFTDPRYSDSFKSLVKECIVSC